MKERNILYNQINEFVALNKPSVEKVFNHYGIGACATPESVLDAVVYFKEPFIKDLYTATHGSCRNDRRKPKSVMSVLLNADGQAAATGYDKFKDIFNKAVQIGTGIIGIAGAVNTNINKEEAAQETPPADATPEERILGINKNLFYIASALVAVLILIIILAKYGKRG